MNRVLPPTLSADQSIEVCGGIYGKFFSEWQDVFTPTGGKQMYFVHGRAAASEFSSSDFWGTHRYRDWNMLLVLDQDFEPFLAPANFLYAGWDDDPIVQSLKVDNPNLVSLMELEWDSGFFAPAMAPRAGDETLAVGRWVFDCGHEGKSKDPDLISTGFRAEIHAPEILVSGHILRATASEIHAQFKIFAGSRSGPLDTIPLFFFFSRFFSSHKNPLGGQDYSVSLHAPGSGWKLDACSLSDGRSADGRSKHVKGTVLPDDAGESLTWMLSANTLKNSARIESSEFVEARWVRADSSSTRGVTRCN